MTVSRRRRGFGGAGLRGRRDTARALAAARALARCLGMRPVEIAPTRTAAAYHAAASVA